MTGIDFGRVRARAAGGLARSAGRSHKPGNLAKSVTVE